MPNTYDIEHGQVNPPARKDTDMRTLITKMTQTDRQNNDETIRVHPPTRMLGIIMLYMGVVGCLVLIVIVTVIQLGVMP